MMTRVAEAESLFGAVKSVNSIKNAANGIKTIQKAGNMKGLGDITKFFLQNKTKIGRTISNLSKSQEETLIKKFGSQVVDDMKRSVEGFKDQFNAVGKFDKRAEQREKQIKEIKDKNKRIQKKKENYPPKKVVSTWIDWISYNSVLGQMRLKTKEGNKVYVFPFFPKKTFLKMRNTTSGAGSILWDEYWHKFGNHGITKKGLGTKQAANIIANNPQLNKILKAKDPLNQLTKQLNKQLKGTGVKLPKPKRLKTGGLGWR